ncbi:hypothetical protein BKA65DRAFT_581473 [Rhexocercosporidium sp. MPI-PUGE-AT-0058]|nr:hypothetical protein BKA65DRAFT_581473 [Rhexocercosporidium sp. MPI-PUGE-AT-0058]
MSDQDFVNEDGSCFGPQTGACSQVSIEEIHGTYVSRLKNLLSERPDIQWSLESKGSGETRVAFTDAVENHNIAIPEDLVARAAILRDYKKLSFCVIENISAEYVEVLGTEWGIDPMFFIEHAGNRRRDELWKQKIFSWPDHSSTRGRENSDSLRSESPAREQFFLESRSGHLDGVFEYHNVISDLPASAFENLTSSPNFVNRHCFKDEKWALQSNTRLSYCRPSMWMYLFLVDAPVKLPSNILETRSPSPPTLRFMYSSSRGGVEFPRLYRMFHNEYSIFENLKVFCQHGWHRQILFVDKAYSQKGRLPIDGTREVLPCHPMMYLLASCLYAENLRYLDKEIKRISFKEIRNPRLEINTELHDRRENLARIKQGLVETSLWIPADVTEFFANHPVGADPSIGRRIRTKNWERLIDETAKLEGFLMETLQLFMSSVSVQDSRMSINQSRRGSQLTLLALIYVPLSFITGIFGMNVQQINSSGLNIWVCFVTLVPVIVITFLVFLAVKLYSDRKAEMKKSADPSKV